MLSLINWRLKVTLNDGRALVGQMLAFDRHMNLVLADCEEFRRVKPKRKAGDPAGEPTVPQEIKRSLGLVILRGETVVSLSVEGPPPVVDDDKKTAGVSFECAWIAGRPEGLSTSVSCFLISYAKIFMFHFSSFCLVLDEAHLLDEAWE
jgi:small nuclear ribonucleoprotein (snRNP)-like protein